MQTIKQWLAELAALACRPSSYAADYAIRTREYLRWIMVFMVAGLTYSVAYQRYESVHDCFQTSISAYYYTPVKSMFVGALVAIGVCLLSMKGKTALEDALLNFAGILTPIVAIVPTPPPEEASCDIPMGQGLDRAVDVANNMPGLFTAGGLTLVLVFVTVYRGAGLGQRIGYLAAGVLWVVSLVLFVWSRALFLRAGHYTAAIAMFAAILLVVTLNALLLRRAPQGTWRNRYTVIAGLMIAVSIAVAIAAANGFSYWVIVIEFSLIALFAVFWALQTSASQNRMLQAVG